MTRKAWSARELSIAAVGWSCGMCARCVTKLLAIHGYERSHRAVQSLPQRYPWIARKSRTGPPSGGHPASPRDRAKLESVRDAYQ